VRVTLQEYMGRNRALGRRKALLASKLEWCLWCTEGIVMIDSVCEVLKHSGGGDFWQGSLKLAEAGLTFSLEAKEGEEDYWTLQLSYVEQLNPAPPANRWARKKPTSRTSELVVWYYSTSVGRNALRKISDWDASGVAEWFGSEDSALEAEERRDSRIERLSSLVRSITAALD